MPRRRDVLVLVGLSTVVIFLFSLRQTLPPSYALWLGISGSEDGVRLSSAHGGDGMEPQAEHGYQSPPDPVDDPLESLAKKYEEVRTHWLSSYDQSSAEELIRTPSGALDPDFNTYISRLESFVETYFLGSASYDPLIEVLSRLVRAQAPPFEARDFEKVIWSFDEGGESGTPGEFELWRERWPDWEVRVGDDALVDRWFQKSVVGMGEGEGQRSGEAAWKELWDGIRRPVMKADLLRYLIMLVEGGLYTDSDTAPLSSPSLWGRRAASILPPPLSALQTTMSRLSNHNLSSSRGDPSLGIHNPAISLVLSVEYDTTHPRQDPRPGYTRDLQIVQWTFLSKPYHPIFLDVLETATRGILEKRKAGGLDAWYDVLDLTGPGPFTDAVLRYFLVQYGVTPHDLRGMENGAIIGDVLLLPLHAFGSFLDQSEKEFNSDDPTTKCVAHGFRGRWKSGVWIDRRRSRH